MKKQREIEDLNPQERLFCAAYADAESETYGNATKSAEVAKYRAPASAGSKLIRRPACKRLIDQFYEHNASQIGRVASDLRVTQLRAEEMWKKTGNSSDLAIVVQCLKLQGERYGMFSSRNILVNEEPLRQRELDEAERAEAQRLADVLARDRGCVTVIPPDAVYPKRAEL